jgi:SAM-dependent methyltransferase
VHGDQPTEGVEINMDFICNICGTQIMRCPIESIDRETPSCPHCHSSVRMRSIVHLLSTALYGHSMPLPLFPVNLGVVGVGLSDWLGYAEALVTTFNYTNTYYHQPPYLDILAPHGDRASTCDFVISTDVFEHVAPPVSRAFHGVFNLLKPGGYFILTVPFTNEPKTIEHFPELHDYRIIQFGDEYILVNRTVDGRRMLHDKLVFHGGPGTTLEMRIFCRQDLERHLADAGFTDIQFCGDDAPQWGILHREPWSLPILARRPIRGRSV